MISQLVGGRMDVVDLEMAMQDNIENYLHMAKKIVYGLVESNNSPELGNVIEIAKMIQKEEHRIVDQYYQAGVIR